MIDRRDFVAGFDVRAFGQKTVDLTVIVGIQHRLAAEKITLALDRFFGGDPLRGERRDRDRAPAEQMVKDEQDQKDRDYA